MSGRGPAQLAPRIAAETKGSAAAKAPAPPPVHPVLGLQRAAGNRATAAVIQRKCASCEEEERVQRQLETSAVPDVQRKCSSCEEERVQRKPEEGERQEAPVQRACDCGGTCENCRSQAPEVPPAVAEQLKAPGSPLDMETRTRMESQFDDQFGDVRVHTGGSAARSAASINALAYTAGPNIVFGASQYAPGTPAGRNLLAHELTHVLQQRGAPVRQHQEAAPPVVQPKLTISAPDDPYEREADLMAEHVTQALAVEPAMAQAAGSTAPALQRQCEECQIAPPSSEEVEEDKDLTDESEPGAVKLKAEGASTPPPSESIGGLQQRLARSNGLGRPLPVGIRTEMERGFGQDFSKVRIHTGADAAQMNRLVHARAFTHENSIFFNEGRFRPETAEGRVLLAHELTHVVQQSGSRAIYPSIQRNAEVKIGNWAHEKLQERLRDADKELITEAAIPGGTRKEKKINVVGFADLYKSKGHIISGISAQEPADSTTLEQDYKFYNYVNMRSDYKAKAKSQSNLQFGPKIVAKQWIFTPTFPSEFQIGELKPLFPWEFPESLAHYGLGFAQTGNYREGFREFVERVRKDNPQHQSKIPQNVVGTPLDLASSIPAPINYREFEQQYKSAPKEAILKADSKQRVWIYELSSGLYLYFLLPHPYAGKEFPAHIEKQLKALDPLLAELRNKRAAMKGNLLTKRDPAAGSGPPAVIQRKPASGTKGKQDDWKLKAEQWEADRKKWVKGTETGGETPKKFLKEQAKGVEKKAKADKELGLKPSTDLQKQAGDVRSIRFWSSLRGRVLGYLRFRFGHVFDKVEELFEKIKKKFKEHHQKSGSLNNRGGVFDGWKKVATKAIIRLGVEILKQMLVEAFKGFVACMNGLIDSLLSKFIGAVDEAKEELVKEVEPICCEVVSFKKKLEEEYHKHEEVIAAFTEAVETIRQWQQILDDVEIAVRIGVEILSCGTPPGLGCLWGLVAQFGISAGLSLLARTDYFEEHIAKPAAAGLMDAIVGDSFHNFLIGVLEATPLEPYLKDAQGCQKRHSTVATGKIGGNLEKLDPNDPKNVKAREEWEKEYEGQILRDLQTAFEGKGKPATKEDLQKLVDALKKLKKTPAELRQMLDSTRNPATGKMDVEKAKVVLEKGEVPKTEEKERKLDYEKAKRNNAVYEKLIGWDPSRIAKKPGIKSDSKEFADAVYDMQEALRLPKKDGIFGPDTVKGYYEKTGLKKDQVYENAVKNKEQAEKDKEAAKGSGEGKPAYNLLNGYDVPIKDTAKSDTVPKGVRVYLHDPDYRDLVKEKTPGELSLAFQPEFATLDIYVEGALVYRVQNIVAKFKLWKIVASTGGMGGIWSLEILLKDGIQLSPVIYPDQELILRAQQWSVDSVLSKQEAPKVVAP